MGFVVFLVFATGLGLLALHGLRRAGRAPATPVPRAKRPAPKAPSKPAPAWDGAPVEPPPPLAGESLRGRLRDRYIAARFPGFFRSGADLAHTDAVIRAARLYFEEERSDLAQELLTLAVDLEPLNESPRLAQLEIAYLTRSRGRFIALAKALREALPQNAHWDEVARLGRALAPQEPLFAAGAGSRPHDHYGPWPDLPNWIQASWDLTGEVLAADFRRAVMRNAQPSSPQQQRIAIGA
jgi:hypothetical protein